MKVLDLFSGIGGFSLGLEKAGMQTVAFCEIDKFCRAVLRKHWPEVPIYDDIRTLAADRLARDRIRIDVICGGFPCQDISIAGNGEGLSGERSGLWREYARLVGEVRPKYVIVENVAALLFRGLSDVLGDLASLGYDAEWHCIPASAVGAPHRRDRIWIVAYATQLQRDGSSHNTRIGLECQKASELRNDCWPQNVANAEDPRGERREKTRDNDENGKKPRDQLITGFCGVSGSAWEIEPNVGRVANGVPARVDRLKALGNAVVPQIPEMIGRAIMQHETSYN